MSVRSQWLHSFDAFQKCSVFSSNESKDSTQKCKDVASDAENSVQSIEKRLRVKSVWAYDAEQQLGNHVLVAVPLIRYCRRLRPL
jgi:hypothetical protein